MVDDLTGEIYAIKEMGIDVIKKQAYLDRKLAWDAAAVDFPELFTPLAEKEPLDKIGGVDVSQENDGMSGVSPSENLEQKGTKIPRIQGDPPEVSVNKETKEEIRGRIVVLRTTRKRTRYYH